MLNSIQREAKNRAAEHFRGITASAVTGRFTQPEVGNIIGWGIGAKVIDGFLQPDENVVRVYVRESSDPTIRKQYGNLPTDVIEVGKIIAAHQSHAQHPPVSCGVSIGHPNIGAGTLGCLVEKGGNHYILSNNHVLANSNDATPGDPVIQPGQAEGGTSPEDNIAILEPYREIDFSGEPNHIDAAIARVGDCQQNIVEPSITDIGVPRVTPIGAEIDQIVQKRGRTTEHTIGVVVELSADIWVHYDHGYAFFENQIGITGIDSSLFSESGDSGSLIVTESTCEPVGLLFADTTLDPMTFANPIRKVLGYYGVAIVGERGADA